MYESAIKEEAGVPDIEVLENLVGTSQKYLEAAKLKAINTVVKDLEAHLAEEEAPTATTIQEALKDSFEGVSAGVKRIVETELQATKSFGLLDGIIKANLSSGVDDPIVFWVVVKDDLFCNFCRKVHLMPNGITPRLWRLSEVNMGYAKKNDNVPSIHGRTSKLSNRNHESPHRYRIADY
jgi:hypothetical protein